jgi:vacuolar-type H+-ATPase subunit I/STV1
MSVVNMKRLTVFVHKSQTDEIVKKLMRLRCVEISECDPDGDFKKLDLDAVKNELDNIVSPRLKSWLDAIRKESEESNTENMSEQERWKKGL